MIFISPTQIKFTMIAHTAGRFGTTPVRGTEALVPVLHLHSDTGASYLAVGYISIAGRYPRIRGI